METYKMSSESDFIIVKPEGEITSRSYPEFEQKLGRLLCEDAKLLFDMSAVTFINSVGIVFLLRIAGMAENSCAYFTMYNLAGNIERIMRRLQLQSVLNVAADAEAAFINIGNAMERELAGCSIAA